MYRYVADRQGAFVQPALFEAFGLTVIEAMSSGLPTFATRFGGPLETIEDGVSGFHIDPNHGDAAAETMLDFFVRCSEDDSYWDSISRGALERVASHYTWELYAERMLRLARIYGFWKFFSNIEREEVRRYLEMLYFLGLSTHGSQGGRARLEQLMGPNRRPAFRRSLLVHLPGGITPAKVRGGKAVLQQNPGGQVTPHPDLTVRDQPPVGEEVPPTDRAIHPPARGWLPGYAPPGIRRRYVRPARKLLDSCNSGSCSTWTTGWSPRSTPAATKPAIFKGSLAEPYWGA